MISDLRDTVLGTISNTDTKIQKRKFYKINRSPDNFMHLVTDIPKGEER